MQKSTQQAGFVLVVAMIMLIAVTGVAVALLVSSGVDNKMLSSAQEAELAINEAEGAHDEAYRNEEFQIGGQNQFSLRIPIGQTVPVRTTQPNSAGNIATYTAIPEATTCAASFTNSSGNTGLKCTYNRVVVNTNYGEVGQTVTIRSVVAQRVLD